MNIEDSSAETLFIMFALNYDNKKNIRNKLVAVTSMY